MPILLVMSSISIDNYTPPLNYFPSFKIFIFIIIIWDFFFSRNKHRRKAESFSFHKQTFHSKSEVV